MQEGIAPAVVYSGAGEDTCLHPAARTRLGRTALASHGADPCLWVWKFLTCLAKEHVKDDVRSVIRSHLCVCVFVCTYVCVCI